MQRVRALRAGRQQARPARPPSGPQRGARTCHRVAQLRVHGNLCQELRRGPERFYEVRGEDRGAAEDE